MSTQTTSINVDIIFPPDVINISAFIYLRFYVAFNTVQVISRRVVGRAEETSTYSWSMFCTVNYRPKASNYQLSHLRPCREPNPGLRCGRRECYHSATVAPLIFLQLKDLLPLAALFAYSLTTVAMLCNAHAFESAQPQSYVIAHKLLICRFEVNLLHINPIIGEK